MIDVVQADVADAVVARLRRDRVDYLVRSLPVKGDPVREIGPRIPRGEATQMPRDLTIVAKPVEALHVPVLELPERDREVAKMNHCLPSPSRSPVDRPRS